MTERERPLWALRLQQERQRRGWNKTEMARRLHDAAGVQYPPVDSLVRQVRGWENGDHFPRVWTAAYAAAFDTSEEELFGEGVDPKKRRDALKLSAVTLAPEMLGRVLRDAAAEAMEFTREAGVTAVGQGTFDHLEAITADLNRCYCVEPPAELFTIAQTYRRRVGDLIQGPHTLKEGRELYTYAAWLSELLAWITHDLGSPFAAEAWAIDAYQHADQAGHDELCAWATDAMASIAIYTDRPARAVEAARQGIGRSPAGHPLSVRLRAQAARAHARLGQREQCEELFREADALHGRQPARAPTRFAKDTGTLASFAMTAYPASAYIWLGDYAAARTYAVAAVAAHEGLPAASRAPSREAIARLDLGIAAAQLGAPDEAVELGRLALGTSRIVDSVRSRAADLDRVLAARYAELPMVRDFRDGYEHISRKAITSGEQ